MNARPTAAAAGKIDVGGDLTVNRLGFGAMRITGPGIWGDPPDRDRAKEALRRAVALDVNFIDTADSYGPEVSERLIARGPVPVSGGAGHRDQGRPDPAGPGAVGARRPPGAPAPGLRGQPGAGCGWTGSTCTSFTGPTRRCRSPSRSARWPS